MYVDRSMLNWRDNVTERFRSCNSQYRYLRAYSKISQCLAWIEYVNHLCWIHNFSFISVAYIIDWTTYFSLQHNSRLRVYLKTCASDKKQPVSATWSKPWRCRIPYLIIQAPLYHYMKLLYIKEVVYYGKRSCL